MKTHQARRRPLPLLASAAALVVISLTASSLAATAAAATPGGPAASAGAIGCVDGASPPAGAVSCTPMPGTPQLAPDASGTVEQIRQLVQCGTRMYAVGDFSEISAGATIVTRENAFSFKASPPFTVSTWNPDVNGEVNSIAVGGRDCSRIYLGGSFSRVHGTRVHNIAEVTRSTGAVRARFRHHADRAVETLVLHDGRVLAGGFFTSINGSKRKYYVSLSESTGADDGYLRLNVSGHYKFRDVAANRTRIYNQQLSPDGRELLAEGDFSSVGGKHREQIFMLSLGAKRGVVTRWNSAEFSRRCVDAEPFYVRAASWSPDGRTIYIADTGDHPRDRPTGATPRTGLCDAAAAFPASHRAVRQLWINYTGCDSLYSTAAGAAAVYFGGHERWASNPDDCNAAGPGAIAAPGMVGLSPSDGSVTFDPTRGRGLGADDMLLTRAGLWIASDNFTGGGACGHQAGFWGICFLPYPSGS